MRVFFGNWYSAAFGSWHLSTSLNLFAVHAANRVIVYQSENQNQSRVWKLQNVVCRKCLGLECWLISYLFESPCFSKWTSPLKNAKKKRVKPNSKPVESCIFCCNNFHKFILSGPGVHQIQLRFFPPYRERLLVGRTRTSYKNTCWYRKDVSHKWCNLNNPWISPSFKCKMKHATVTFCPPILSFSLRGDRYSHCWRRLGSWWNPHQKGSTSSENSSTSSPFVTWNIPFLHFNVYTGWLVFTAHWLVEIAFKNLLVLPPKEIIATTTRLRHVPLNPWQWEDW